MRSYFSGYIIFINVNFINLSFAFRFLITCWVFISWFTLFIILVCRYSLNFFLYLLFSWDVVILFICLLSLLLFLVNCYCFIDIIFLAFLFFIICLVCFFNSFFAFRLLLGFNLHLFSLLFFFSILTFLLYCLFLFNVFSIFIIFLFWIFAFAIRFLWKPNWIVCSHGISMSLLPSFFLLVWMVSVFYHDNPFAFR